MPTTLLKPTKEIINYFMECYGVDVSKVKIIDCNLNEDAVKTGTIAYGEYVVTEGDVIRVDVEAIRFKFEKTFEKRLYITIVHELTHWMQYTHNKGAILQFIVLKAEDYYSIGEDIDYRNRPLEIDARLGELRYLHYADNSNEALLAYTASALGGVRNAHSYLECLPQDLRSILLPTATTSDDVQAVNL